MPIIEIRSEFGKDVKFFNNTNHISNETLEISLDNGDITTLWELMERGYSVSNNGRCLGWRDATSAYSWLTYGEFLQRAKNFGLGLAKIGMIPGQISKVGIYAKNCVEWVVSQYGLYSQSSVVVPLYDTLGANASSFIINHADLNLVVCDTENKVRKLLGNAGSTPYLKQIISVEHLSEEVKKLAEDIGIELYLFSEIEELGTQSGMKSLLPRPSDVCLICYTSGTTGDPKGVVMTHGNVVAGTVGAMIQMGIHTITETDVTISYLPLAHVFEQVCETLFFLKGGSIGFFRGDNTLLVEDMKVLQPTFFPGVPRVLNGIFDKAQGIKQNALLKASQNTTNNQQIRENEIESAIYKAFFENLGGKLRLVLSGAAPISETVLNFYRTAFGCVVMEAYGQTECSGPCSLNIVTDDSIGNVGSPVPCCKVKLVDVPDLEYFSSDNKGEVCIKGENVFIGYLKDTKRTLETIDEEGWLHTGDIGSLLPNGHLKIIDRKKHIFKLSQGEYVAPEKIENAYLTSSYVAQILVHGESLQSHLVAIVFPQKETILAWCKENLLDKSWSEICENETVKTLILEDMQRRGKDIGLHGFEQVKAIHLHPELLTLEGGFLTPTMKTKRAALRKYFKEEIENLYNSKK